MTQVTRRALNATSAHNPNQMHEFAPNDRRTSKQRSKTLRVMFFCNGDRFFKGKKLNVSPQRYVSYNDLLNDVTTRMPAYLYLPNGVRQIFTPTGGRRINDMDELKDGQTYVCGGNETFKPIKYGSNKLMPWGKYSSRPADLDSYIPSGDSLYAGYNAFPPSRFHRPQMRPIGLSGMMANGQDMRAATNRYAYLRGEVGRESVAAVKPRVVSIVRQGPRPRNIIKILLNRRSVQGFPQLMADISEAFGSKWKSQELLKLYTVGGREVHGVADFFRDDDVFIGTNSQAFNLVEIADILDELYPNQAAISNNLLKSWERLKRREERQSAPDDANHPTGQRPLAANPMKMPNVAHFSEDKRDSGFDESELSHKEDEEFNKSQIGGTAVRRQRRQKNHRKVDVTNAAKRDTLQEESVSSERLRFVQEDQADQNRRFQQQIEKERDQQTEDKRRRGLPLLYHGEQDPHKRMDIERRQDRKEQLRQKLEKERSEKIAIEAARVEEERRLLREAEEAANRRQQRRMQREAAAASAAATGQQPAAQLHASPGHKTHRNNHDASSVTLPPLAEVPTPPDTRESAAHFPPLLSQSHFVSPHLLPPISESETKQPPVSTKASSIKDETNVVPPSPSAFVLDVTIAATTSSTAFPILSKSTSFNGAPTLPDITPAALVTSVASSSSTTASAALITSVASSSSATASSALVTSVASSSSATASAALVTSIVSTSSASTSSALVTSTVSTSSARIPAAVSTSSARVTAAVAASPTISSSPLLTAIVQSSLAASTALVTSALAASGSTAPVVVTSAAVNTAINNKAPPSIKSTAPVSLPSKMTANTVNGGKPRSLIRQISNVQMVLDRYELGKTLGDGNFAVVRLARKRDSGNEYAMKIIDKSKLRGKEHMVQSEVEIMRLCRHPNIVQLKEEYETTKEIYLVMELVRGGDLFDAISQSVKFNEVQASLMVADLSNALFYLHSRSIVHRDMKPENLMVCRNKDNSISLKLADFGLAMEIKRLIYTVCGTPTYVAPEILEEKGYGLEVDLWALGVITYILLCGFPPFRSPDRNQTELFELIKAGDFEFISPYWDKISKSAKDLIENLLVVDRLRRYSAIDVLCHPWVLTVAGSRRFERPMAEHRDSLRRELEQQAASNLEQFRAQRQQRQQID